MSAALDREAIAARIPHDGAMCLLDAVVGYDETTIDCRSEGHRDPANPLRTADGLAAVTAVEYAAQAMAVHGALGEDSGARAGYLAALRQLELHCERLDTLAAPLAVHCERIMGDGNGILYAFSVSAGDAPVADGRAMVLFAEEGSHRA